MCKVARSTQRTHAHTHTHTHTHTRHRRGCQHNNKVRQEHTWIRCDQQIAWGLVAAAKHTRSRLTRMQAGTLVCVCVCVRARVCDGVCVRACVHAREMRQAAGPNGCTEPARPLEPCAGLNLRWQQVLVTCILNDALVPTYVERRVQPIRPRADHEQNTSRTRGGHAPVATQPPTSGVASKHRRKHGTKHSGAPLKTPLRQPLWQRPPG